MIDFEINLNKENEEDIKGALFVITQKNAEREKGIEKFRDKYKKTSILCKLWGIFMSALGIILIIKNPSYFSMYCGCILICFGFAFFMISTKKFTIDSIEKGWKKQLEALEQESKIKYKINDEGIVTEEEDEKIVRQWNAFSSWGKYRYFIYIVIKETNKVLLIDTQQISDEITSKLEEILNKHLDTQT